MKKIDRRIIIVAAFIFIVGLSFGLMKYLISLKDEPPQRRVADARRFVRTEMVEYSTIVTPVEESGRLKSLRSIDLVAEASGKILQGSVELKEGAMFSKGDLLFTIYSDEAELDLQGRKSSFMNSIANLLPDLRIDYPDHLEIFTDFFGSISIDSDLPALPEFNDKQLKVFLSSRNIISEFYSIKKDELKLSRHNVYAPFTGNFSDVYMEVGSYTNTGGRVAHAIQTDMLELEVPVRKDDARWIKIGDKVDVLREGYNESWKGRVTRKGMFIDEETQRQSVFVSLRSTPENPLLNGEYLLAMFPGHPEQGVMEIPRSAVFNSNEVFVVVDGKLEKREIDIVKKDEKTLIFRGLQEGELLVTQALINVQEGIMVRTEMEEERVSLNNKQASEPGGKDDALKKRTNS